MALAACSDARYCVSHGLQDDHHVCDVILELLQPLAIVGIEVNFACAHFGNNDSVRLGAKNING